MELQRHTEQMSTNKVAKKNRSGGSAAAGGMNYQAAVTAIAFVHMARSLPLGWTDVGNDIPSAVSAEEGSAGDDLRIDTPDGSVLLVQVKKGISAGEPTLNELVDLADESHGSPKTYAILVVDPHSSGIVRDDLAIAVRRLGDGRVDDLNRVGRELLTKLNERGLPPESCARLRIKTIHALVDDGVDINLAKSEIERLGLSRVIGWNALYQDAGRLIEFRGRRTVTSFVALFTPEHTASVPSPLATARKLLDVTLNACSSFTVFGIPYPLKLENSWLRSKVALWTRQEASGTGLADAIQQYHDHSKNKADTTFDAEGLGWYHRQCVVVGGPGMGKSTLLRRLRLAYASKSDVALLVPLRELSKRIRQQGSTFEEGLLALSVDATGVAPADVRALGLHNITWLLDGLDECGDHLEPVTQAIHQFASAYPGARMIISTRPIGYDTRLLDDWRHYRLLPPADLKNQVACLIQSVESVDQAGRDAAKTFAADQLKSSTAVKLLAACSPMLASMIASMAFGRMAVGSTEASFYSAVLEKVHAAPTPRRSVGLSKAILNTVLHQVGWTLMAQPESDCAATELACTAHLRSELGSTNVQAQTLGEEALGHWEAVGILERVRHRGLEAYAFVHRTFQEFAAAKRFVGLADDAQVSGLRNAIQKNSWRKVLEFAWDLGMAGRITEFVVTEPGTGNDVLVLALKLVERDKMPTTDALDGLWSAVWPTLESLSVRDAYELGEAVVGAVTWSPCIAHAVGQRLESVWMPSRLTAWAMLAKGCPHLIDTEKFIAFLDAFVQHERGRPRLHEGFDLGNPLHGLVRTLVMGAMSELVRRGIDHRAEAVVSRIRWGIPGLMYSSLEDLQADVGWPGVTKKAPRDNYAEFFKPEDVARRRQAEIDLLDLIGDVVPAVADDRPVRPPWLQLSGLLAATSHDSLDDELLKPSTGWPEPVLHVLQATLMVGGFDKAELGNEVAHLRRVSSEAQDGFSGFYGATLNLDVELDWTRARRLSLNACLLEKAIEFPSLWIGLQAANLLAHSLEGDALDAAVQRLLGCSGHETLRVASLFAKELGERSRPWIEDSLAVRLKDGCRYLFDVLAKLPPPTHLPETMAVPLAHGLCFGPYTAMAASEAATAYIPFAPKQIGEILHGGYQHWLTHPPARTSQHADPDDPRAAILKALVLCGPQPELLLTALDDDRSDVRDVAQEAALSLLTKDDGFRYRVVQLMVSETTSARLLRAALDQRLPFSPGDVALLANCLRSAEPKVRMAAIGLLDPIYLPKEQIAAYRNTLAADPIEQIRERIASLSI